MQRFSPFQIRGISAGKVEIQVLGIILKKYKTQIIKLRTLHNRYHRWRQNTGLHISHLVGHSDPKHLCHLISRIVVVANHLHKINILLMTL